MIKFEMINSPKYYNYHNWISLNFYIVSLIFVIGFITDNLYYFNSPIFFIVFGGIALIGLFLTKKANSFRNKNTLEIHTENPYQLKIEGEENTAFEIQKNDKILVPLKYKAVSEFVPNYWFKNKNRNYLKIVNEKGSNQIDFLISKEYDVVQLEKFIKELINMGYQLERA